MDLSIKNRDVEVDGVIDLSKKSLVQKKTDDDKEQNKYNPLLISYQQNSCLPRFNENETGGQCDVTANDNSGGESGGLNVAVNQSFDIKSKSDSIEVTSNQINSFIRREEADRNSENDKVEDSTSKRTVKIRGNRTLSDKSDTKNLQSPSIQVSDKSVKMNRDDSLNRVSRPQKRKMVVSSSSESDSDSDDWKPEVNSVKMTESIRGKGKTVVNSNDTSSGTNRKSVKNNLESRRTDKRIKTNDQNKINTTSKEDSKKLPQKDTSKSKEKADSSSRKLRGDSKKTASEAEKSSEKRKTTRTAVKNIKDKSTESKDSDKYFIEVNPTLKNLPLESEKDVYITGATVLAIKGLVSYEEYRTNKFKKKFSRKLLDKKFYLKDVLGTFRGALRVELASNKNRFPSVTMFDRMKREDDELMAEGYKFVTDPESDESDDETEDVESAEELPTIKKEQSKKKTEKDNSNNSQKELNVKKSTTSKPTCRIDSKLLLEKGIKELRIAIERYQVKFSDNRPVIDCSGSNDKVNKSEGNEGSLAKDKENRRGTSDDSELPDELLNCGECGIAISSLHHLDRHLERCRGHKRKQLGEFLLKQQRTGTSKN